MGRLPYKYSQEAIDEMESIHVDPTTTSMASLVQDLPRGRHSKRGREALLEGTDLRKRLRRGDEPITAAMSQTPSTTEGEDDNQDNENDDDNENENENEAVQEEQVANNESTASNDNDEQGQNEDNDDNDNNDGEPQVTLEDPDNDNQEEQEEAQNPEDTNEQNDLNSIQSSTNAVQVRFDSKTGKLVVDETSLTVARPQLDTANSDKAITEDHKDTLVNSSTWLRKRTPTRVRWTTEDTNRFYYLYRQHGDDYECIAKRMKRDRKQIKSKAMSEVKVNPARMKHALQNPLRIDPMEVKRDLGIDVTQPVPVDPNDTLETLTAEEKDRLKNSV